MFNHGAMDGVWWGEDYAFSNRWRKAGGKIWVIPDMNIDHHGGDICYAGNFHKHLLPYSVADIARSDTRKGQKQE